MKPRFGIGSNNHSVGEQTNKMAGSKGLPHRSDHSYDERDDLFFDSDDEKDSPELADNSDEGLSLYTLAHNSHKTENR